MEKILSVLENIKGYLPLIRLADLLDVAIVAYLVYKLLSLVKSTRAANILKGVAIFLAALWLSSKLNLRVVNYILSHMVEWGVLALIIVFQPEIRRILEQLGSKNIRLLRTLAPEKELPELERAIDQTVLACTEMSRTRTGVLIVFERKILLDDVVRSGTTLDASVSSELLKNIFFVKAPMHDGAVIIRNGRILGAGCMLPLSKNVNLSRDLGMRHRAGIGMSENSDAVVVIVSEETGSISVAIGGMLKRHLQAETLSQLLHNELMPQQEETEIVEKVLQAWETSSPTGVVRNGQNEAFYYRTEEVCPGTLSIVCIQDRQLSQALDGVVRSITAALLVSCVAVAGINLYSILRYRKYSRGLRKMFDALRSRQGEQRAAEDPQESTGSEILLQRILNNDVDLEELQGLVESKRELKAELDALYGHVQINSHFLLNTLDSIYWSSVSRMGADSKESAMIGDLCEILKYALDSSDLYTSLREEVECTLRYIEIQQMRKNIVFNVEWDIPDELYNARVCKLILQPVIENCVQHAFQTTKERAFRIRIAARKTEEGYLCISVEDNGYGISPKRIRQMNLEMKKQRYLRIRHIGLANVNRRLQVQFGGRSGVSLSAIEGCACALQ